MTCAEFRVASEWLGLDIDAVAALLEVSPRTVARWSYGHKEVPDGVAAEVASWLGETAAAVEACVARLRLDPAPAMTVYRTDEEYRQAEPDSSMPAAWHRALAWRVAQQIPGLEVRYPD